VDFILAAISSPYVLTAILLQGIGFMLWIFVLSKMKLGLAFATSGAFFYILIALSSWYLYGEELSIPQWVGLALISLGVILISYYQG
jgi:multidrug transporter EmrE-like cation transporter